MKPPNWVNDKEEQRNHLPICLISPNETKLVNIRLRDIVLCIPLSHILKTEHEPTNKILDFFTQHSQHEGDMPFIDCDYDLFRHVLNWISYGKVEKLDSFQVYELSNFCKLYNLTKMLRFLKYYTEPITQREFTMYVASQKQLNTKIGISQLDMRQLHSSIWNFLENADIYHCNLSNMYLYRVEFKGKICFYNCNFSNSTMFFISTTEKVSFLDCDFTDAKFGECTPEHMPEGTVSTVKFERRYPPYLISAIGCWCLKVNVKEGGSHCLAFKFTTEKSILTANRVRNLFDRDTVARIDDIIEETRYSNMLSFENEESKEEFITDLISNSRIRGKYKSLTSVDLSNRNLDHSHFKLICANLLALKQIIITNNNIGDDGIKNLFHHHHTTLSVHSNNITINGVSNIVKMYRMKVLGIGQNDIGDEGGQLLANHLHNLTGLEIRSAGLGIDSAIAIAKQLKKLTFLDISHNDIKDEGIYEITRNLTKLTTLNITMTKIIKEQTIVDMSPYLTQLTELYIEGNNVGIIGAKAISENMGKLTTLWLGDTCLGDEGMQEISKLSNLTDLGVESNDIGGAGCSAVRNLTKLNSLYLTNNNIQDGGAKEISKLASLTTLYVENNDIGDEGAQYLKELKNLRTLRITRNWKIGIEGREAISTLKDLNLVDLLIDPYFEPPEENDDEIENNEMNSEESELLDEFDNNLEIENEIEFESEKEQVLEVVIPTIPTSDSENNKLAREQKPERPYLDPINVKEDSRLKTNNVPTSQQSIPIRRSITLRGSTIRTTISNKNREYQTESKNSLRNLLNSVKTVEGGWTVGALFMHGIETKSKETILKALMYDSGLMDNLKHQNIELDKEFYIQACKVNPECVYSVPKSYYNRFTLSTVKEITQATGFKCQPLFEQYGKQMEEWFSEYNFVLKSISINGMNLKFANEKLRNDSKIIETAINQNADAVLFVPEEKRTARMLLDFFNQPSKSITYTTGHMFQTYCKKNETDERTMMKLLSKHAELMEYFPFKDRLFLLMRIVDYNSKILKYLDAAQFMDFHPKALKYCKDMELRSNFDFVLSQMKKHGILPLKYASNELRSNREFMLQAVAIDGMSLAFALNDLSRDRNIVLEAVRQNGLALEYVSEEFCNDREIVMLAVKQNGSSLRFASNELANDKGIVLEAVRQNGWALEYASDYLKQDTELILQSLNNEYEKLKHWKE